MNAVEESLTSSANRAGTANGSASGAPAIQVGNVTSATGRSVSKLLKMFGNPPFEFQLWNGEHIVPEGRNPVARIIVREPSVLWGMLRNPGLHFGDAYSDGRIEIEGDIVHFMEEVYRGSNRAEKHKSGVAELVGRFLHLRDHHASQR